MHRTPRETLIFLGGLVSAAALCKSIEMITKETHKHETVSQDTYLSDMGAAHTEIDQLKVERIKMDQELTQWDGFYADNKQAVDAIMEDWIEREKNIPFSDKRLSRRNMDERS